MFSVGSWCLGLRVWAVEWQWTEMASNLHATAADLSHFHPPRPRFPVLPRSERCGLLANKCWWINGKHLGQWTLRSTATSWWFCNFSAPSWELNSLKNCWICMNR